MFANQTEKTIVRNVFSTFNRAQQPVSKPKNWVPVSIVQLQKGCLVAVSCSLQQNLVCGSLGQSALDPAGLAPAIVTSTRKKVTGSNVKTCAAHQFPANTGEY
jgi:hypothetical protein